VKESQADEPPLHPPLRGVLDRALSLVEFLRANCPWDAAQTHDSLRRYLLEESHEVLDAITVGNDAALRDELGDLLLNVAFQIVIAEERSVFDREQVVGTLEAKMQRRHPHLFGGAPEPWESIKARERGVPGEDDGILAGLFPGGDPLAHAFRIQDRVAGVGFDWADAAGAFDKVREEVEEVGAEHTSGNPDRLEEEIGDLLFAVVNFARRVNVHPSSALVRANSKFSRRFERLEGLARERGINIREAGLDALDGIWDDVKREEQ
jgi:nucleoside triphosphate diphosphatase